MKKEALDELIGCLPRQRTLFHYFKGQYAFHMLSYAAARLPSVSAIKQSPFKALLNQPDVKSLLSRYGSGVLTPELFEYGWSDTSQPFVLTVDSWGAHDNWQYQTSRKGCNLVLQLNFSEKHDRAYQHLVKPDHDYVFNYSGHPVTERRERDRYRNTLAWARLDIDLDCNQVLIEEVQSDWVRRVDFCTRLIKQGRRPRYLRFCKCQPDDFLHYAEAVFAPLAAVWSEAMLMAAIHFIYQELGIKTIYYHTHESGQKIKQVVGEPPRSLYSDLPRKFCFQTTDEDPLFMKNDRSFSRKKRAIKELTWYRLAL